MPKVFIYIMKQGFEMSKNVSDDVCVCVYKWPNIQDHVWATKACIS